MKTLNSKRVFTPSSCWFYVLRSQDGWCDLNIITLWPGTDRLAMQGFRVSNTVTADISIFLYECHRKLVGNCSCGPYNFWTDAVGQKLANPLRNYWYDLNLIERRLLMYRPYAGNCRREMCHWKASCPSAYSSWGTNGLWKAQQQCWRSSSLNWKTRSPPGHGLVSVRGRMGLAPCVDVPGEQILLSTSASNQFMGESSGPAVAM